MVALGKGHAEAINEMNRRRLLQRQRLLERQRLEAEVVKAAREYRQAEVALDLTDHWMLESLMRRYQEAKRALAETVDALEAAE